MQKYEANGLASNDIIYTILAYLWSKKEEKIQNELVWEKSIPGSYAGACEEHFIISWESSRISLGCHNLSNAAVAFFP